MNTKPIYIPSTLPDKIDLSPEGITTRNYDPMKLYIVTEGEYSDREIRGFYDSEEKAKHAQEVFNGNEPEEFDLNALPDTPPGEWEQMTTTQQLARAWAELGAAQRRFDAAERKRQHIEATRQIRGE